MSGCCIRQSSHPLQAHKLSVIIVLEHLCFACCTAPVYSHCAPVCSTVQPVVSLLCTSLLYSTTCLQSLCSSLLYSTTCLQSTVHQSALQGHSVYSYCTSVCCIVQPVTTLCPVHVPDLKSLLINAQCPAVQLPTCLKSQLIPRGQLYSSSLEKPLNTQLHSMRLRRTTKWSLT